MASADMCDVWYKKNKSKTRDMPVQKILHKKVSN